MNKNLEPIQRIRKEEYSQEPLPPVPPNQPQSPPSTGGSFRTSAWAAILVYFAMAITAVMAAIAAGMVELPKLAIAMMVVLGPVIGYAVRDYVHWVSTGEWTPPTPSHKH